MAIVTSDVDDEYNWTEVSRKFAKDLNDPIAPTPRNCLERYLALLTETIDTDKKVCVKTEVGSGLEWTDDEVNSLDMSVTIILKWKWSSGQNYNRYSRVVPLDVEKG